MNRWLILFCVFLLSAGMLISEDVSTVEKHAAECSAGNQEACRKLADIAKNDKDSDIREAAVRELTDQELIADIARNDEWWHVRQTAVKNPNLTDQTVIADIARNDTFFDVRIDALRILIKTPKPISAEAIARLQRSQKEKPSDWGDWEENACRALIKGIPEERWPVVIKDMGVSISLPKDDPIPPGRYTFSASYKRGDSGSIENVSFSAKLELDGIYKIYSGVFDNSWNPAIKLICKGHGCDSVAKNHKDNYIRLAAAEKLTNQTVAQAIFANIAKNDKDDWVRWAAVKKLLDQTLLADIAKNDKGWNVRAAAVEKLTDMALLADIARNCEDSYVRMTAVEKLNDQIALADIARNDEYSDVRRAAVWKLTDQVLLADIARNDKDSDVRDAAERRLKELQKNK